MLQDKRVMHLIAFYVWQRRLFMCNIPFFNQHGTKKLSFETENIYSQRTQKLVGLWFIVCF